MRTRLGRGVLLAVAVAGSTLVASGVPAGAASGNGIVLTQARPAAAVSVLAAACRSCGRNLIINPGAEAGPSADGEQVEVPGWTRHGRFTAANYTWSGGDLSATTPGPKARGKNYFYGGPSNAKSWATQTVRIAASGVRTGKIRFTLSGWLGGYSSQADRATVTASFRNARGKQLATARIGPVTEANRHGVSGLYHRKTRGKVPAKARQVVITVLMLRAEGNYNDGLAENLSLVLR